MSERDEQHPVTREPGTRRGPRAGFRSAFVANRSFSMYGVGLPRRASRNSFA